jgi:hypothetical protein
VGKLCRLLGVSLGWLLVLTSSGSAGDAVRGPWPLVSFASLGTLTWRCDPAGRPGLAPGLPALALGFRTSAVGQSGVIRLRVGRRTVVRRDLQPGGSIELPYLQARIQQVEITEGGEDGTLRASVTVTFGARAPSGFCWPYMPPTLDAHLLRRH